MKIKDIFPTGRALGVPIGSIRLFFDPSAMIAASAGTTNAIIGAAGSIYGSNSAVSDSRSARDYDAAKTIQARNWQQQDQVLALQEAQRAREYSTKEREAEQAFIAHQNSVQHQVAQMLAAGINPAVVFGQVGSGGQIGSAPTNPSVAHAALAGAPIVGNPVSSFSRSAAIRDMAVALQSLNSSGSELVKSLSSARKIDSEVNLLIKQAQTEEQKAAYNKALVWSTNEKLPHEVRQICANINLMLSQGKVAEADAQLKHMQETYTNTQNDYLSKQLPFIAEDMQAAIDLKREQQKTEKTQQNLNVEKAVEARETARLVSAQADIEDIRADIESSASQQKLKTLMSKLKSDQNKYSLDFSENLRQLEYVELHRKQMGNRYFRTVDQLLWLIQDKISGAINGVSPVITNVDK